MGCNKACEKRERGPNEGGEGPEGWGGDTNLGGSRHHVAI